uniref:Carn_acyltransf domain-containing protein n=1 Tax=Syphacia muris TaxID=451379 RepID=A0A0N5AZC0_9BILA
MLCYLPIRFIRGVFKYFYFDYKGFLFENPSKTSWRTKIWSVILQKVSSPKLCSCESLLPKLPVPKLSETIDRYLCSIEPITDEEEFQKVSEMARRFKSREGRLLQLITKIYSFFVSNYVTNFWEKYAYLYSRSSLLINSSVGHCDLFAYQTFRQAERAARIAYIETQSMLAIDRQALKPVGNGLLSSTHYKNCYAACRLPGKTFDQWKHYALAKHILVLCKGCFFRLPLFDKNNHIFSLDHFTRAFDEILNYSVDDNVPERYIAAFTTDRRDIWFKNRQQYFIQNPVNRQALQIIESAAFVINLDETSNFDYDPDKPELLSEFMKNMITGNGSDRWVDKSLNYTVGSNGRCGGTTEHSVADGADFDHIMENYSYMDVKVLKLMADDAKKCFDHYQNARNDVDCQSLIFRKFGKGLIKKRKVSPDAFVQMAIQLAYFKDQKKFVLTYEPGSPRFYANSRTETLRSVTKESCAFVRSMLDEQATDEERLKLLNEAAVKHVEHSRECMIGKGVDRHLFVLLVFSKMLGFKSPFLDYYINQQWILCTSQAPNMTGQIDEDEDPNFSWLGAGFGAVSQSGYGLCYRFAGNHSICLHITSYKSCEKTDSERFKNLLVESFDEMANLLKNA